MKRLAIGGGIALGLVAIAACATSEEPTRPSTEPEPEPSVLDASVEDVVVGSDDADIDLSGPPCNPAGWCKTALPDADLVLRDIWPLPDRAFAIADSKNAGVKVLEWTSLDSTWRYIDDNSQNEKAFADFATRIWAPSADEVYYAVSPGTVFHGRRPVPPATAWSWSSSRLQDNNARPIDDPSARRMATGVWGTDSNDVYAWYSNTVFRGESRGDGGIEWVAEYIANDFDDADEQMAIVGVGGTQGNDLWFTGWRGNHWKNTSGTGSCSIVVRKTSDGYRRIADGIGYPKCQAREGVPLFLGNVTQPMEPQSLGPNRILLGAWNNTLLAVQIVDDGHAYFVRNAAIPSAAWASGVGAFVSSFWRESEDFLWLVGGLDMARGIAVRGTRIWDDGGTYQLSSTAHDGVPSRAANRVRGTSATNLWIVGDRYALHKTTP